MTNMKTRVDERLDRIAEKDAQERRIFWREYVVALLRAMRLNPDLSTYIIFARGLSHAMECYERAAVDAMRIRNYRS